MFTDEFSLEPISIIGNGESSSRQNRSSPNLTRQQTEESDVLSSGDDLPLPSGGKRKVIVAQRPNSFMWSLKVGNEREKCYLLDFFGMLRNRFYYIFRYASKSIF